MHIQLKIVKQDRATLKSKQLYCYTPVICIYSQAKAISMMEWMCSGTRDPANSNQQTHHRLTSCMHHYLGTIAITDVALSCMFMYSCTL